MPAYGERYRIKNGKPLFEPWLAEDILNELPYYDLEQCKKFYDGYMRVVGNGYAHAFLGCNDRFYLLTRLLNRPDLEHPWLFDRCREVEAGPYGHIDLWARAHGKTSIITTGGVIQEVLRNPEVTIGIFSVTKPLAQEILAQIKQEFEGNETLKALYPDVLYENPRGKDPQSGIRPAKWSIARGLTVKRIGKPKEATIEAHGLIDGQPIGRHFDLLYFDDIVTPDFLSDDLIKKTTARFEMADNLGTRHGSPKSIAGTRYHFADTLGVIIDRKIAVPRVYPATVDGTINGELVLLTPENWQRIKVNQGIKTLNAQMLLNPVAGSEATFNSLWLHGYEVIPRLLNVYILVDPSKGSSERSDRTAIAVIGIDPAGVKYLLDGVCHRMRLTERFAWVMRFKEYYEALAGVQAVKVGWEQYGAQTEIEVVQDLLMARNKGFTIEELATPRVGGHTKQDRIERLEPDIRGGRFYIPAVIFAPEYADKEGPYAGYCFWSVWTKEQSDKHPKRHHIGQILYRPMRGFTKLQRDYIESKRVVTPLKRLDEQKSAYDLTRVFIDEMVRHPFAKHDDLIDAVSRIYDIDPLPPMQIDAKKTESLDYDDTGIFGGHGGDYDDA